MDIGTMLAGVVLVLLWVALSAHERELRLSQYKEKMHAALLLHDVPGQAGETKTLMCDLYRAHTILGRRKRKCDVCLDCYEDLGISREHAVLWYDGRNFHIAPVYSYGLGNYTQIRVDGECVPPAGVVLHMGESVQIAGHELQLIDTTPEEKKEWWM